MIKYFTVENFKSIKNESILEFDSNLGKDYSYPSSAVIGFAGANASGKTCILKAIRFVFWFMQSSFFKIKEDQKIPCQTFIGNEKLPTKFHVIFTKKNIINNQEKSVDFEYKLTILKGKVLTEELYYYPYRRSREVYLRQDNIIKFGNTIKKINREIFANLRENCSIISFASQFASQTVAQECQKYHFYSKITNQEMEDFDPKIMENFSKDQTIKTKVLELLKIADVGIEDFKIYERSEAEINNLLEYIANLSKQNNLEPSGAKNYFSYFADKPVEEFESFLKLQSIDSGYFLKDSLPKLLKFKHKLDNQIAELVYDQESAGTLQFLTILHKLLSALESGSLIIIDEIELKLHQNLVAYLIGLFENKYENTKGSQLVFSFHNTYLMEILKPHQLWFTEKNDQGQTEIFSAADFKDIKNLDKRNLEELYRLGRFGAKPRGI